MDKLELFLPIDPAELPTAQQKGVKVINGRVMFFETSRVKAARKLIMQSVLDACKDNRLFDCDAYQVTIVYVYRPATIRRRDYGMPKVTRPDVDNLTKLVLDAISDSHIAWDDDGAVSSLALRKRYAYEDEEAFIYVLIEPETQGSRDELGLEV